MTEDDTYKKLKGYSANEAIIAYHKFYREGLESTETSTMADVWDYVESRLQAYGWTCDRVEACHNFTEE